MNCPKCFKEYTTEDVEQHTSDCGYDNYNERKGIVTMTCETCECEFEVSARQELVFEDNFDIDTFLKIHNMTINEWTNKFSIRCYLERMIENNDPDFVVDSWKNIVEWETSRLVARELYLKAIIEKDID